MQGAKTAASRELVTVSLSTSVQCSAEMGVVRCAARLTSPSAGEMKRSVQFAVRQPLMPSGRRLGSEKRTDEEPEAGSDLIARLCS